ncbi:hypothetical protein [Aquisalimonas sp.]|uniref:hypothetical protein n=1 Tax=Aquisalimonas sp. TaxID=1872621 RepID=UPI0025B89015|nr:hypothetical protein [Aquisalimonas sp.]
MRVCTRFLVLFILTLALAGCNSSSDGNDPLISSGGGGGGSGDGSSEGDGADSEGDSADDDAAGGDDDDNESESGAGGGRAHEIVITAPRENAVVDTQDGVYGRRVTVLVSDNDGEPVPDGTRVRLGVMDSVITYGNDGEVDAGDTQFTSGAPFHGNNLDGFITRQSWPWYAHDGFVLVKNAAFPDRRRRVDAVTGPFSLDVTDAYEESVSDGRYWVGASAMGISIVDEGGSSLEGNILTTQNGKASFRIRYPTRREGRPLIGLGCARYNNDGTYPEDPRFPDDPHSGQVLLYAEVLDHLEDDFSRFAKVDTSFCFSGIAGGSIEATPAAASDITLSPGETQQVTFYYEDGGDGVPYAFRELGVFIDGLTDVDAQIVDGMTNGEGYGVVTISAGSNAEGDGSVMIFDGDASLEISVTIDD